MRTILWSQLRLAHNIYNSFKCSFVGGLIFMERFLIIKQWRTPDKMTY